MTVLELEGEGDERLLHLRSASQEVQGAAADLRGIEARAADAAFAQIAAHSADILAKVSEAR